MNVCELGPVTALSRSGQQSLHQLKLYNEKYWYIFAQLLDAYEVGTNILIDKYRIGAPYELRIVGILTTTTKHPDITRTTNRAEMNTYVQLICDPIKFTKSKDVAEIDRAYENANKMLST